jgi:hypothetical protein
MKPLTLLLLLGFMVVILSSGCISDTPQKKPVISPVTTNNPEIPEIPATLQPSPAATDTPVQVPVITQEARITSEEVIVSEAEVDTPNLRILKINEQRPEVGKLTISGIAKNDGKTTATHAEVQVKFYDANNNLIVSSKDITDNFEPGGTWGYSVSFPGPDSRKVYSYKVSIAQI